jgi:hypothetical protein
MAKSAAYEYKAITSAGEEVAGRMEAEDLEDAIAKLRTKGLYPTWISCPPGAFPKVDPACKAVQLRLLQAFLDGAMDVVFDFGRADPVTVRYCIEGQWHPMLGISEVPADQVQRVLCEMSGLPELGRSRLSTQKAVSADITALPSRIKEIRLGFYSPTDSPDVIGMRLLRDDEGRTGS